MSGIGFGSGGRHRGGIALPLFNRCKCGGLEAAGVEFIAANGGGAGVRLGKPGGTYDEGKRPEELDETNDD